MERLYRVVIWNVWIQQCYISNSFGLDTTIGMASQPSNNTHGEKSVRLPDYKYRAAHKIFGKFQTFDIWLQAKWTVRENKTMIQEPEIVEKFVN